MERLNINYDLLAWEGDILRLKFWEQAFKILKESGAVFLQDSGKLAGCWVMRIDPRSEEATNIDEETANNDRASDDEHREKVIVRSNGLVTYVGKDIAYQFWKFGLLGKNFHYQIFDHSQNGKPIWTTTSTRSELTFPEFGKADAVYNVIDTRQSYLQELLKQALQIMGHPSQAESSVHFSYEMVALSNQTAQKLGYATSINSDRSFVEVSGRKGLGVKADDLINRMIEVASVEVTKRNADLASQECEHIAKMIAVAAVRYFMIKYSRGKVIIFDIDDALSFEGESGPYLQYAVVRANKILQKLKEQTGTAESDVILKLGSTPTTCLNRDSGDGLWVLILECARLDEVVNQAIRTHELSGLAKYAFSLAQTFNAFYHREPILKESKMDVQLWRAATVIYFRTQMTRTLDLMGCQVPPRM
jgi:arginyl-tRNA synthetase